MLSITVPTLGRRRGARLFPVIRTWALVQRRRARLAPAPRAASVEERRARNALRLLMTHCPVAALALVLGFFPEVRRMMCIMK